MLSLLRTLPMLTRGVGRGAQVDLKVGGAGVAALELGVEEAAERLQGAVLGDLQGEGGLRVCKERGAEKQRRIGSGDWQ